MDDYISREDVSDWLKQYGQDVLHGKYKFSLMYIWKNLMDLSSADVVVPVRCEYCKYHIVSRQGRLYCIHGFEQTLFSAFSAVDNPIFEREFDSFCSYGKRREE